MILVCYTQLATLSTVLPDYRCSDGVQNGDETDIDCGGSNPCPGCATGALS